MPSKPSKKLPTVIDGYRRGDREFFRGHAVALDDKDERTAIPLVAGYPAGSVGALHKTEWTGGDSPENGDHHVRIFGSLNTSKVRRHARSCRRGG